MKKVTIEIPNMEDLKGKISTAQDKGIEAFNMFKQYKSEKLDKYVENFKEKVKEAQEDTDKKDIDKKVYTIEDVEKHIKKWYIAKGYAIEKESWFNINIVSKHKYKRIHIWNSYCKLFDDVEMIREDWQTLYSQLINVTYKI